MPCTALGLQTTKAGRIDIRLDSNKMFECSDCVTLPVYKEAAIQNGKRESSR